MNPSSNPPQPSATDLMARAAQHGKDKLQQLASQDPQQIEANVQRTIKGVKAAATFGRELLEDHLATHAAAPEPSTQEADADDTPLARDTDTEPQRLRRKYSARNRTRSDAPLEMRRVGRHPFVRYAPASIIVAVITFVLLRVIAHKARQSS